MEYDHIRYTVLDSNKGVKSTSSIQLHQKGRGKAEHSCVNPCSPLKV